MDSDFEVIAQQLSIYQISLHDIQHKENELNRELFKVFLAYR